LKATNTDIAIEKYPIGQTPVFKDKKFQLLWRYWKCPKNHNIATTSTFAATANINCSCCQV